ncbi:MAG: hypothetical protein FWG28_01245 [Clostridiales bacterium]|nr:hypothetical protein [Clostridiales bacterium]
MKIERKRVYARCRGVVCGLWEKGAAFVREERGDLVSSLGWMAIMALALVLIKSIVDGGLSGYANNIFSHLDKIFNL